MGVVLSWWGGGGPWLGGFVGCPWRGFLVTLVIVTLTWLCGASEGLRLPSKLACLPLFFKHLALVFWTSIFKIIEWIWAWWPSCGTSSHSCAFLSILGCDRKQGIVIGRISFFFFEVHDIALLLIFNVKHEELNIQVISMDFEDDLWFYEDET